MNFFDKLSGKYVDVVKWFLLILSTVLLIFSILMLTKAITLPNHPVFDAERLGASYTPAKSALTDEVALEYIKKSCSEHDYQDNELLPTFKLFERYFKKDGAKFAGCLQEIVKGASVPDALVPEWYSFFQASMKQMPTTSKDAHIAAMIGTTANAFMIKLDENSSQQRNFDFNLVKGAIALSLFLMFVFSCMFLVLVRIENNTRK